RPRSASRRPTSSPSPSLPKLLGELSRRPPTMADRVLFGRIELGHRAVVLRAGVDRDERRVVAEASRTPRILGERSLAAAPDQRLASGLVDVGEGGDIGDGAILRFGQLAEEQIE